MLYFCLLNYGWNFVLHVVANVLPYKSTVCIITKFRYFKFDILKNKVKTG